MNKGLDDLCAVLRLEDLGDMLFRGVGSSNDGADGTYGGHILGQASSAALATVDNERHINSLHGYFIRGGEPGVAIDYQVEVIRDGRSFCTRRVTAIQHEKTIFELTASFTKLESGEIIETERPQDFAELPRPETLLTYRDLMQTHDPLPLPEDWALRDNGIDIRMVNAPWTDNGPSKEQCIRMWIKANGVAPKDHKLHSAMLAYQSDESLADNLLIPFNRTWGSPDTFCVSLDHAMWFHQPVDLNNWHFVDQRVLTARNGRGVGNGYVWSEDAQLIASFTQEVLLRL